MISIIFLQSVITKAIALALARNVRKKCDTLSNSCCVVKPLARQLWLQVLHLTSIAPAMAQTYHNVPKVEQSKEELKPVDCAPNDTAAIIVRGTVIDETNEPLIGAMIHVLDEKGKITKLGTATDYYGQFAIRVSKGSKVQIRYIGYKIVTKKFNKPEENLVIKLKDEDMQLTGEVVIVKQKTMPDVDADIYEMR